MPTRSIGSPRRRSPIGTGDEGCPIKKPFPKGTANLGSRPIVLSGKIGSLDLERQAL